MLILFVSSKEQTPTICFLFLLLRTYQGIFAEQRQCEFKSLPHESQKTVHSFQTAVSPVKYLLAKFQKALLTVLSLHLLPVQGNTAHWRQKASLSPDKGLSPDPAGRACPILVSPQSHIRVTILAPYAPTTGPWHNKCSGRMYFISGKVIKPLCGNI